ncbi:MAG: lipid-A-disaccharide synthase, partial [Bacteroidetes bacterium]|nr:lipid-A-disaccharide synthase [Bacteroidota bacterium]
MKYYLIAGEASGDLHGANLVRALKSLDSDASFRGVGGEAMQSAGVALNVHYRELSFMGFIEVLQNLSTVSRIMKSCKADIKSYVPTALILIDFSGFNLRIAKWARQNGIIVHYYIAPQVWAS